MRIRRKEYYTMDELKNHFVSKAFGGHGNRRWREGYPLPGDPFLQYRLLHMSAKGILNGISGIQRRPLRWEIVPSPKWDGACPYS